MNFKLDVIKLANDDVVATSAQLCTAHPEADHFYSFEILNTEYQKYVNGDYYEAGNTTSECEADRSFDKFDPEITGESVANKWYYYNGNKLVECNGNHDDYTMYPH